MPVALPEENGINTASHPYRENKAPERIARIHGAVADDR